MSIERGEKYRQNFQRLVSEKLFMPRDQEGNPNLYRNEEGAPVALLEQLRTTQEKLSEVPEFVAVMAYGSLFHGYSNEKSDLDIHVLYDAPDDQRERVASAVGDAAWQVQPKKSAEGYMVEGYSRNINFDSWKKMFEDGKRDFSNPGDAAYVIPSWLCGIGVSRHDQSGVPLVDTYRKKFAAYLSTQKLIDPPIYQEHLVDALVENEMGSWKKIAARMPELAQTQQAEETFKSARRTLWQKRVDAIFHLNKES